MFSLSLGNLAFVAITLASTARAADNDGIHLAISPICGTLKVPATNVSNVNAGLLPLSDYTTIVSFGDSYTSAGEKDGSTPKPAVVIPPSPEAGGRVSNGPVWIENIAADTGALFKDYAVSDNRNLLYR